MARSPKKVACAILVGVLAALAPLPLSAQADPPAVLSQPIVDKFIRDLPVLLDELDELGHDFDGEVLDAQGDPASFGPALLAGVLAEAGAEAGVSALLRSHGWDDGFWEVYYVVFSSVYVATMEQAMVLYPELADAFGPSLDPFRATIHRDDTAIVLRNLERLADAFDRAAGDDDGDGAGEADGD
ncbi:MAG: hypothetical protein JXA15_02760 [Spirochaetales bacterium]|nr:hypothetical protein [Spirochaetales bacterium]